MGLWLNTLGRTTLGIGICDRCRRKFSLDDLSSDPNSPGLKVCAADKDLYDPYRLPPRKADDITLRFVRPDVDIATSPSGIITEDGDYFLFDGGFEYLIKEEEEDDEE